MTEPASLILTARENCDYDEEVELSLDAAPLDLTAWTNLKMTLNIAGTSTLAFTLTQVGTAAQGIRPLSPLTAGVVRIRVDRATLAAVPDGTGLVRLTGDLVGNDPEGIRRAIADVTMVLSAGVTA